MGIEIRMLCMFKLIGKSLSLSFTVWYIVCVYVVMCVSFPLTLFLILSLTSFICIVYVCIVSLGVVSSYYCFIRCLSLSLSFILQLFMYMIVNDLLVCILYLSLPSIRLHAMTIPLMCFNTDITSIMLYFYSLITHL